MCVRITVVVIVCGHITEFVCYSYKPKLRFVCDL